MNQPATLITGKIRGRILMLKNQNTTHLYVFRHNTPPPQSLSSLHLLTFQKVVYPLIQPTRFKMADGFEKLSEVPVDFIKDGSNFLAKCKKPDQKGE